MSQSFSTIIKHITKLADVNPTLRSQLQNYCYDIQGCCQEVHRDMGPFLNEYIYQEALDLCFEEHGITGTDKIKEYYFKSQFHGKDLNHTHKVDFFIRQKVYVECKAIETLGSEQRQQLWNYMRLSNVCIGFLYNFAPINDQCERYYYDLTTQTMYMW